MIALFDADKRMNGHAEEMNCVRSSAHVYILVVENTTQLSK